MWLPWRRSTPPGAASVRRVSDEAALPMDWGALGPLHLTARAVADGVLTGAHRSIRRGAGVEFGGHRSYVPGDDLRWIDRRAWMRHRRLLVREHETERERAVRLVVDATRSMAFRGTGAPGSKLAFSAVIAAALARIALSGGDRVSLHWWGGAKSPSFPLLGGRLAFERILGALEDQVPGGDVSRDVDELLLNLGAPEQGSRRGTVTVLISDFLDVPEHLADRWAAWGGRQRPLVAVQVLDPTELDFSYSGSLRLKAAEGESLVETDADVAREGYQKRLQELQEGWRDRFVAHAAAWMSTRSDEDPVGVVRRLLVELEGLGS